MLRRRLCLGLLGFLFLNFVSVVLGNEIHQESDSEGIDFKTFVAGDKTVRFYERMIGEAIVEGDYVVFQFDTKTGELLGVRSHWRDDLPDSLPQGLIAQEQAESLIEGEVAFSNLYYISPESDVFECECCETNPCWVVRSLTDSGPSVTIVDALTGRIVGKGVPPPARGFSLTGPFRCPANGA